MNEIFTELDGFVQQDLPTEFTYPWEYTPHPIARKAAAVLMERLESLSEYATLMRDGKMFGVLIVQEPTQGKIGFLSAYSGDWINGHAPMSFVPSIGNFVATAKYRRDELTIKEYTERIEDEAVLNKIRQQKQELEEREHRFKKECAVRWGIYLTEKLQRSILRTILNDDNLHEALNRRSAYQKAEFARWKKKCRQEMEALARESERHSAQLQEWKQQRQALSQQLQLQIFDTTEVLNAEGEAKSIALIFSPEFPPSGAGDCAAPKLLQYAYKNGYKPYAMAEFWVGQSPQGSVRHHGSFYGACQHKCGKILGFMLQGLTIEKNPRLQCTEDCSPKIVYEDDVIVVVEKPPHYLSVQGKDRKKSVQQWAQAHWQGAKSVHRLDEDTSGLLIVAKRDDVFRTLQRYFAWGYVQKEYEALLSGSPQSNRGTISLPLVHDYENRPRVRVAAEGKSAITHYHKISCTENRFVFRPLTGRTHQIRVHAAMGLNAPILGDTLYAHSEDSQDRMYLHCRWLRFPHPTQGDWIEFYAPAPF